MKKRTIIGIILFIFLSTYLSQEKLEISKFDLKKITVENNNILEEKKIKNLLAPVYDKNLIFLYNWEIEKLLMQNGFIDGFELKKIYPNTLKIKIFEKKPIAILYNKKKKYYLSEKIDLIEFKDYENFENLPYVFGNKEKFKIFYNDLNKINFPFDLIKKFTLYESNRWDIETTDQKIIKLPSKKYIVSLENYLKLREEDIFNRYKVFDYRLNNQLILK